jgi:hypothetical protein
VGIRFFPTQLFESAGCLAIAAACVPLCLAGTPGAALTTSTLLYALLRFALEEWRGDPDRGFALGLSEARWSAVATTAAVCVLAAFGVLPLATHDVATGVVLAALLGRSLVQARGAAGSARHLSGRAFLELADAVRAVAGADGGVADSRTAGPPPVRATTTRSGLRVSGSRQVAKDGTIEIIGLSSCAEPLGPDAGQRLLAFVARMRPRPAHLEFLASRNGVFHLVAREPAASGGPST